MTNKTNDIGQEQVLCGSRFLETKHWTEAEVLAAVARLKLERPRSWADLEELERNPGYLRGTEAMIWEFAALSRLYPDCGPDEIVDLAWHVRIKRRAALNLM